MDEAMDIGWLQQVIRQQAIKSAEEHAHNAIRLEEIGCISASERKAMIIEARAMLGLPPEMDNANES